MHTLLQYNAKGCISKAISHERISVNQFHKKTSRHWLPISTYIALMKHDV